MRSKIWVRFVFKKKVIIKYIHFKGFLILDIKEK